MGHILVRTQLEIYTHPNDLVISIEKLKKPAGKYDVSITRGPRGNFKPLASASTLLETRDKAVGAIESTLKSVCETGEEFFRSESELPTHVLTHGRCAKIVTELRAMDVAKTFPRSAAN